MDNNETFKKVKLAITKLSGLKDGDLKECFRLGGFDVSVAQFDSYKVSKDNKRHKPMSDEALGAFLNGLIAYGNGERSPKE